MHRYPHSFVEMNYPPAISRWAAIPPQNVTIMTNNHPFYLQMLTQLKLQRIA